MLYNDRFYVRKSSNFVLSSIFDHIVIWSHFVILIKLTRFYTKKCLEFVDFFISENKDDHIGELSKVFRVFSMLALFY